MSITSIKPKFHVFLAHNSKDKPRVRKLAKELKKRKLNVWLDEEQIRPGFLFQDEIQKAFSSIQSVAVIIGRKIGKWQAIELKLAISQYVDQNKPVIPVLLPRVQSLPRELLILKEFNWVRFHKGLDETEALDKLQWGITGKRPKKK